MTLYSLFQRSGEIAVPLSFLRFTMMFIKFIFCILLAIGMSEGFMHLCSSYELTDIEKILIFVGYVVCITKFTYIIMKERTDE